MKQLQSQTNLTVSGEILSSSEQPSMSMKWLQTAADLRHEDLTEPTVQLWKKHLSSFPDEAIEFAFETWLRTSEYFPMPVDITKLVGEWRAQQPTSKPPKYDPTGWGEPQVLALWNLFQTRYPNFKRGDHLSKETWDGMMREVENMRVSR